MKGRLILVLVCILLSSGTVFAASDAVADVAYETPDTAFTLNIATADTKPISLDRLVYEAIKDIGYQASFSPATARTTYGWAQSGEKDGVISSNPNLEAEYDHLIQIPIPLDYTNVNAYTVKDSTLAIPSWDALDGLRVGLLSQHSYDPSLIPLDSVVFYKDSVKQLMDGLLNGEYDVAITDCHTYETVSHSASIRIAGRLETWAEYLYLNKKSIHLRDRLTDSLTAATKDGRAEAILSSSLPRNGEKKTILHIITTNSTVDNESEFAASLYPYFDQTANVEWYTVSLDVKRFPDRSNRFAYFAKLLRQDFLTRDAAAILISGDDALAFIGEYYYSYFPDVPVLFYGVNNHFDPTFYDLEKHMSGIVLQPSAYDTAETALALYPDTREIFVINDYSVEGQNYRAAFQEQLAPLSDHIRITYNDNTDLATLLATIRSLPPDSLVLLGSYFNDYNGQYYSQAEMSRHLIRACSVPYFSINAISLPYQSIGGKCPNYARYADEIAQMLIRLLNGEPISEIPIIYDSGYLNEWAFNQTALDRYGINRSALPDDAHIINRTLNVWETDPILFYGGITAFLLIFSSGVYLFILLVRLQKKNKALLEMSDSLANTQELLAKEISLNEMTGRLERLVNTAPIAYALTVDGIVVEANDYMKNRVGMQVGEGIVRYYTYAEQHDTIINELRTNSGGSNMVISMNMADGSVHRFMANFATSEYRGKPAYLLWVMDIEKNELQKDMLRNTQQSLQTILDTLPVPVYIMSSVTKAITYVNQAGMELFEVRSSYDALGSDIYRYIAPKQDELDAKTYIRRFDLTQKPYTIETTCVTAEGHFFDAQVTATDIDYLGEPSSLGIIKDLTAEKAYQDMLRNTADREKEANMLKSRFLVNVSHEIRTPMNAVIGLTDIELRKKNVGEAAEVFKKINQSAKGLLNIINDILDLSKIEANKMEIYENEFELEETLNSALMVSTPRLDGKPVECLLKLALDVPRYLIGDKTRIWQIIKNFMDNAAKYTNKGKIILDVELDDQQSNDETVYITFAVTDTGIGIDDEHLHRIFIPYEQIYNEAQTRYNGTGLGMVISKQLCEMMGGTLRIVSEKDTGTSVFFTLPFKRSDKCKTHRQLLASPHMAGKRMLLVDDNAESLEIMRTLLTSAGAECVTAASGAEAINIVYKCERFDCILMDYAMDGLNGIETALQLGVNLSVLPVMLMVTGFKKDLYLRDIQDAGFADVIEKPFTPSQFMNQISAALGYRQDDSDEQSLYYRFTDVRLLLCEDNMINQEVAAGMLEQLGINPLIADDGSKAFGVLNGQPADIALMDLHMPNMDGYETTSALRASRMYRDMPIISLTADAMTEVQDKCLAAGMSDYLTKPIDFIELHNKLLKWLPVHKRVLADNSDTQSEEEYAVAYPVINGISYADGVSRFAGVQEAYERALLSYAQSLPDPWPAFEEMTANLDESINSIHQMKGISGNLGIRDVYRLSTEFEKTLKRNKPDARLYGLLGEACVHAKTVITDNIAAAAEKKRDEGTTNELQALLTQFEKALNDYDPVASDDIIAALNAKTWPGMDDATLRRIIQPASDYDFENAYAELQKIRAGS